MKKLIGLIAFLFLINVSYSQFKVPEKDPSSYVMDYDGVLTQVQKEDLDRAVREITKKSTVEIAVVILSDLQGYEIEGVSITIGREWGVGKRGVDNGLVYLIAPKERKSRIEVGYGLEGDIPDITANQLQNLQKKYFKEGDYYGGILEVLTNIGSLVDPIAKEQRQKAQAARVAKRERQWDAMINVIVTIVLPIIVSILLLIIFFYIRRKKKFEIEQKRAAEEARIFNITQIKNYLEGSKNYLATWRQKVGLVHRKVSQEEALLNFISPSISLVDRVICRYEDLTNNLKTKQIDTFKDEELKSSLTAILGFVKGAMDGIQNLEVQIAEYKTRVEYVKKSQTTLPISRNKAIANLPNTVYNADHLRDDLFNVVINTVASSANYPLVRQLETTYSNIINYQEIKRKEEEKKKRDEEDEDRRRRRNNSYASMSSSYSSSSSSSSTSFGGGSFGGGGASSSW